MLTKISTRANGSTEKPTARASLSTRMAHFMTETGWRTFSKASGRRFGRKEISSTLVTSRMGRRQAMESLNFKGATTRESSLKVNSTDMAGISSPKKARCTRASS